MVKIKIEEVLKKQKEYEKRSKAVKEGLNDVSKKMNAVPNTPGFSGSGQEAMEDYVKEIHGYINKNMIDDLQNAKNEFDRLVKSFRSNVDNNNSAVLDSNYIKDKAKKLKRKENPLYKAINKCNEGVFQAQQSVSVTALSPEAVSLLQEVYRSGIKTADKLEKFDQQKPSKQLTNLNKNTKNLKYAINSVSPVGLKNSLNELLQNSRSALDSDWYKKIKKLITTDPNKAFEEIVKSDKLMKHIKKDDKLMKLLLKAVEKTDPENLKKTYPILKKFYRGQKYFKQFDKYASDALNFRFTKLGRTIYKDEVLHKYLMSKEIGKSAVSGWNSIKDSAMATKAVNRGKKIGKGVKDIWSKAKTIPMIGKGAAAAGKLTTKVLKFSFITDVGIESFFNIIDDPKHDIGKGINNGVIDAVLNIGPVSGAITLSSFGLGGIFLGASIGLANLGIKKFNPKFKDDAKSFIYDVEDSVVDEIKTFGKNAKDFNKNVEKKAIDIGKQIGRGAVETYNFVGKASKKIEQIGSNAVKNLTKGVGNAIVKHNWNIIPALSR